jgi:hypothetical protein
VRKVSSKHIEKVIALVNRKKWWHVPPRDPDAYRKRGKFLASSFAEAEFWGRPLDEPLRVTASRTLFGDELTIEKALFGVRMSYEGIAMEARFGLDKRIKRAALAKGYDSILLMSPRAFQRFRSIRRLPRTLELNVLEPEHSRSRANATLLSEESMES